jgi:AcrR family transcriptional regulator
MKNKTNDIVEKVTTLFIQNGLQSVSMDEIALYSGISKKTLYENFQSKEMLVNTIVQQIILRVSKYIRVCTDISPNAIAEMANFHP